MGSGASSFDMVQTRNLLGLGFTPGHIMSRAVMSRPTPHRTPLRRLSQGSLFALSRSGNFPDAPHGLGFIEPALAELIDEAEALHANVEALKNLSDSLATFDESFASWLYVLNMNALTTDWPQVSDQDHLILEDVLLEWKCFAGTN
jgi:hypothetical protein